MGNTLHAIDLGPDFNVDHMSCGQWHTCALSTNNELKCFGLNSYGQLGYGHTQNMGDEADEMGDSLSIVDLGSSFVPIQVDCGNEFTCALSTDFAIKCWGGYAVSLSVIVEYIRCHALSHHISFYQK